MIVLSYETAIDQLNVIAEAQAKEYAVEDFEYFSGYGFDPGVDCEYSDGERPLCIIGVWLHKIYGKSNDFLLRHHNHNADDIALKAGIELDEKTMHFLNKLQSNQDTAHGWKNSVERAALASRDLL